MHKRFGKKFYDSIFIIGGDCGINEEMIKIYVCGKWRRQHEILVALIEKLPVFHLLKYEILVVFC
jgi:hypothetical protein